MKERFVVVVLCMIFMQVCSIRIFLNGGACLENSTQVWNAIANSVPGRTPHPKACDQNWDTTQCPRIAIITSAASSQEQGNKAYSDDSIGISYKTMTWMYGMTSRHVSVHIDNYITDADVTTQKGRMNLQIITKADIIFFNGGDQSGHVRSWLNDDGTHNRLLSVILNKARMDQVVLAGTSAGTMIWGKQTFGEGYSFGPLYFQKSIGLAPKKVTDAGVNGSGLADNRNGNQSLQYRYNAGKMPAFGLLFFNADTHFNARGRLGRLVPIMIDIGQVFSIGVDENTTLFYDNGIATVYGWNGVTFVNVSNAVVDSNAFFSIKNVTLHYLSDGDKFDFNDQKVHSNKPLIGTPAFINPYNSDDILSDYEASLSITRLVNQRPPENIGKTKTPSAFPTNTPTFSLKFYKNSQTKGYYSNKKYTAENVVLDISYSSNHLLIEQE